MAKKYLDYDGLLYFWQKIKTLFSSKAEGVKTITRSGTTFTVTRADDTTFTFTQQDNTVAKTSTTPKMDGTAAVGSETKYAAGDHVHPTDTSRAPLASPTFTGTPKAPTAVASTDTTQIATTAFVHDVVDALNTGVSDVKVDDTSVVTNGVANVNTFTGATSSADGSKGLVKAPSAGSHRSVLFGDASWRSMSFAPWIDSDGGCGLQLVFDDDDTSRVAHIYFNFANEASSILEASTSHRGFISSADKTKLNGIASGAEVNVQSDWNQTTTTADDYIKNKPTIPSAGTGSSYPVMDGTRSLGSQGGFARVDHVHPTDTTRAPLASPEFTGTPKAPTAASGTNTTQIATTAFVKSEIDTAVTGATAYQGIAPTSFAPTNYKAGWYWIVGTAGTYVGQVCEAGDMIFCSTTASTYSAANFDVVQTNLDITSITNAEIDTILAA